MNKNIDFIKATRYALGGGCIGASKFRKIISKGRKFYNKHFFKITYYRLYKWF